MIYTLNGFAIFFFIFWCTMWLIHLIAIFYGKYRLHKKVKPLATDVPYPGVSILKPLMGVDPHLVSNLETFFTMSYPVYEILFCVEDEQDPAIDVVNSLTKKYPQVSAKLYTGGSTVGVNPKINNMNKAYEATSYDLILISDSGIRMKEDTLLDMVNHMTEKTGIVHQMPFTSDRNGFAATLEKIYFGTAQSRIYLAADCLRFNCHTGMSTLMRKAVLEEQGGLKTFGCYLAEDFFIAKSFMDRGWKTAISGQPALQNSGICDVNNFTARLTRFPADPIKRNIWISVLGLSENDNITKSSYICSKHFIKDDFVSKIGATDNARYLKRYAVSLPMHQVFEPKSTTRWAKLRVAMLPIFMILFEPLSECMVIGACAAWAASVLFHWEPSVFCLIHILCWFLCDWMLLSIVQNGTLPFRRFDFIIGWLVREFTGPYLFLLAIFNPTIKWRNRVFKLAWGGMAQEIKPRIKC